MKTTQEIIVCGQFEGTHCWPDCDVSHVEFLRDVHRHIFHWRAFIPVEHSNRAQEFITVKRKVQNIIEGLHGNPAHLGARSCEMMAKEIMEWTGARRVEVYEDNENGGAVDRVP